MECLFLKELAGRPLNYKFLLFTNQKNIGLLNLELNQTFTERNRIKG